MTPINDLGFIKRNIDLHVRVLMMNDKAYRESGIQVLELLNTVKNPMDRTDPRGHITCSGFVVNKNFDHAVLIHHAKLQRWLQPGGHMEEGEYPGQAASREVQEETGLQDFMVWPPGLIDIDIHEIPENKDRNEPAHLHYDLRYLFVAGKNDALAPDYQEVTTAAWVPFEKILNDPAMPESIKRMTRQAETYR